MDYKSLIDETKQKIDNYSFDDEIYDTLYSKAYANLNAAYDNSNAVIDSRLESDRRQTLGNNILQTRSLSEQLNARGLSSSGESGLLRINQAVSLNNALASLNAAAMDAHASLDKERNLNVFNLERDIASMKDAAMKADKDRLYQRLSHLESLSAEDEQFNEKLRSDEEQFYSKLAQDNKQFYSKLAQDNEQFQSELAMKAEQFAKEYGLKEQQYQLDYIELSMKIAEEEAKKEEEQKNADKFKDPYYAYNYIVKGKKIKLQHHDPDIDAKTYAANILKNDPICQGEGIYTVGAENSIFKTLGWLATYNRFTEEYLKNVVKTLESFGFKRKVDIEFLCSWNAHYLALLFNSDKDKYYNEQVFAGVDPYDAEEYASKKAFDNATAKMKEMKLTEYQLSIMNQILAP